MNCAIRTIKNDTFLKLLQIVRQKRQIVKKMIFFSGICYPSIRIWSFGLRGRKNTEKRRLS